MPGNMQSVTPVILLLLSLFALPVSATGNETQQWSTLNLNYRFNDTYSANLLTQGRFAISDDRANIYVFRPSIHRAMTQQLTLGLGVDYLANDPGDDERRLWQELVFKTAYPAWSINQRVRLEQRFIEDIKTVFRSRYLVKAVYPIENTAWSLVAANEVFFNLNSRGRGPSPGFDQNRLFSGFGYRISAGTSVELGYLWRYLDRRDTNNIHDHALAVSVTISL